MEETVYKRLKAEFLSAYANVPHPLRKEIIAVIGEDTFSWSTAKEEISRDTGKAPILLEHLTKIGVL